MEYKGIIGQQIVSTEIETGVMYKQYTLIYVSKTIGEQCIGEIDQHNCKDWRTYFNHYE